MAINYNNIPSKPVYYNQPNPNWNWTYQPSYTQVDQSYGYNGYNTTTPAIVTNPAFQDKKDGINWVQGEAGAKSFFVPSGQTAMLMDSEESVFYIKSVDASGMPLPLRIFDYKERNVQDNKTMQNSPQEIVQESPQVDMSNYITREEFEKRINGLKNNRKGHNNNGKSAVQSSEQ